MDRETHRRFLQYRESFPYWNSPHAKMLDRETFMAFDAELAALQAEGRDALDGDGVARVAFLRKKLLRDW